jgi:hypothetical protein
MTTLDEKTGRAPLRRAGIAVAVAWVFVVAGCGVQAHKIEDNFAGAAGVVGTTGAAGASASGAAGVTGAAGTGLPGAGGDSGSAGTFGSGAAGTTGSAGVGAAGTSASGAAGVTGAAGSGATGAAGTTGNPSGVTVMLGGTAVPKENAIAFIHFGHSNMAGRGRNPTGSRPYHFMQTNPHAWMYHAASQGPYATGALAGFELAIEPKTSGDRSNVRQAANPTGGPGTTLVKQAAEMAPDKYFISLGYGVGSIYCTEYLRGTDAYDRAMTAAKELKGKVTFGAIIILLGITERHGTAADIQNYPSCLNELVTAVRTDLGEPNLPFILNGYEMCSNRDLAPNGAFAQAIIPRIAAVPTTVSNSAIVPTDNPLIPCEVEPNDPDGDHHFTLDGHREYMRRVLQIMKDKGWWRW